MTDSRPLRCSSSSRSFGNRSAFGTFAPSTRIGNEARMRSGLKVEPKKHKLMFATEEMVAELLAVKGCWWVWTLCRDDRNGVDAKDLCPSPCQCCLDGFQFVDRVGFNRGGDAVFALYILGHLPCPPSFNAESNREKMVRRVDVGVNPRRPPWGL